MRQNIIISFEGDNLVETKQHLVPASEPVVNELSNQASPDAEIAPESTQNHDLSICDRGTPLQTDRWIYRMVVGALSLTLVASLGGAIWLQANDKAIPEILIALGTGTLGGLAGLLAPTPAKE